VLRGIVSAFKARGHKKIELAGKVSTSPTGITIERFKEGAKKQTVAWESIESATAFKRDLFAYDLICVAIRIDSGIAVEIDERMEGWQEFCEGLEAYLPNSLVPNEWLDKVMHPALKPSTTIIYSRSTS